MSDKKKKQLGMNHSTASHRLVKDILWKLIEESGKDNCCKCGKAMRRDTFSIEHITPWLDSEDPKGLFFDLENIGFSHLRCNISDARKKLSLCGTENSYNKGCRCLDCKSAKSVRMAKEYTPQKRRAAYLRNGS